MKNFDQEKLVMELREGSIQYRDETHSKKSDGVTVTPMRKQQLFLQ